jgi:hypothetical protein
MNKIIFLDVDGVLNSYRNVIAYGRFPFPGKLEDVKNSLVGPESELDPLAIGMVRTLCELTGAQIVLHSMWRRTVDPLEFGGRHRLDIIDDTNHELPKIQGIAKWLKEHPRTKQFVILDDDTITDRHYYHDAIGEELWKELCDAHIMTNMNDGLTFLDFANAFLCISEKGIAEIREDNVRIATLRAKRAARDKVDLGVLLDANGGGEKTTVVEQSVIAAAKHQAEVDDDELGQLVSNRNTGEWAVSVLLEQNEQQ